MRGWLAAIAMLCVAWARADRILLIPLDSRPAAGQFAQMIARMANVDLVMPPYELLGRYVEPGKPDAILDWLEGENVSDVIAVVVSADMICYGGLIASRVPDTPESVALERLNRLISIRRKHANVRYYCFSAIMRLYPTSTRENASWRLQLGRYMELEDRYRRTKSAEHKRALEGLLPRIPALQLQRYRDARARDHAVQRRLIKATRDGAFDYLILGQDDAQPYGPHIQEQAQLARYVSSLEIGGRVYQCEGIDQHANVLVSRALLRHHNWVPRVRIVFSDDAGRQKIANYESKSVMLSLQDQVLASGARPVTVDGVHDYSLFVNTPEPRPPQFGRFLSQLEEEIDQGFPVAVADINLGKDGTADDRLFFGLSKSRRMMKLLAYAGWNTAGNTMGTAIPAANVFLLARKIQSDPLTREVSQREFLLHRFVNDFEYHRFTRPAAYKLIDSLPKASREETYGDEFDAVNAFVRRDVIGRLMETFATQFEGAEFFVGAQRYEISGIDHVKVFLPWPRAYEVRIEFQLLTRPIDGFSSLSCSGNDARGDLSRNMRARGSAAPKSR